jgi:hypothetical protein
MRLRRAKEVQDVLFLRRTQRIRLFDHLSRLRLHAATQQTAEEAAVRGMRANRVQQVGNATVVKDTGRIPSGPVNEQKSSVCRR